MDGPKTLYEFRYSKARTAPSLLFALVAIEPIRRFVVQGINFHEYYLFVCCFLAALIIFWNFMRVPLFAIVNKPGLVLTSEDITLTEAGYTLRWNDITGIDLNESGVKTVSYTMVISVKDDWEYIGAIANPVLRYWRWYTRDNSGYGAFQIELNYLDGDVTDIYSTVENCFHNYKQSIYSPDNDN